MSIIYCQTDMLSDFEKDVLNVIYRHDCFSLKKDVSAKTVAFDIWADGDKPSDAIKEFDRFYRKVRYAFNTLEKKEFIGRIEGKRAYQLR